MADGDREAPVLVLGPLLRYVGETAATIWVETDRPCEVDVLGRRTRTFEVAGHHYGLLVVDGLQPGTGYEYQVTLDGTVRWPEPGSRFPPSVLRTLTPGRPQRLVFGSCRTAELPAPRGRRQRARHEAEHGPDALAACALGLPGTPRERWPDVMLLIGDQVYADEVGSATRRFIEERRDPSVPPGYEVADFAEYCALYREAWSEPSVRWLLSVIPTIMIFDDHDVHDDWNTSASWRREFTSKPWWRSRITGAYLSYWLYQHIGNLSPEELGKDEVWRQVQEQGDAAAVLGDLALRADQRAEGIRWSVRRDFGRVRVVVIDVRSRRVVEDDRRRLMVDEAEWEWVTDSVSGDWDHLVLATSLPLLLPRGIHAIEAWNEAVCAGAWGNRFARVGERVRQAVDLEHWAAFGRSFANFERLLTGLATGAYGEAPASITIISGDVHHSYLAPVEFYAEGRSPGADSAGTTSRTAVYQAVCSPIRNVLPPSLRRGYRLATSRAGTLAGAALARLARADRPAIRWRVTQGPWFYNMLCALEFSGRAAHVRFDRAVSGESGNPRLQLVYETDLVEQGGATARSG
jgi:PhoD-like phosphatase